MREDSPIARLLLDGWQQPGWLNRLCLPLSWLYSGVMRGRRWAARQGLMTVETLPVPVIVVGNLSVGGTGKSPLVIALAQRLAADGWKPGIVSRGYGGATSEAPFVVTPEHTPEDCGDEPRMMFEHGSAPIAVGHDRVCAARLLLEHHGCDVILSDDGFQHLRLDRDIDIVVIDGERGLGNGWCLPAGPLRESRSALGEADLIVVNGATGDRSSEVLVGLEIYSMTMQSEYLYPISDPTDRIPLGEFAERNQQVVAMAGIGNPRRFFQTLEATGLGVDPRPLPDHHPYSAMDFARIGADEAVVITAKDAVKIRSLIDRGALDDDLAGRIWVLEVVAHLENRFYDAIRTTLETRSRNK